MVRVPGGEREVSRSTNCEPAYRNIWEQQRPGTVIICWRQVLAKCKLWYSVTAFWHFGLPNITPDVQSCWNWNLWFIWKYLMSGKMHRTGLNAWLIIFRAFNKFRCTDCTSLHQHNAQLIRCKTFRHVSSSGAFLRSSQIQFCNWHPKCMLVLHSWVKTLPT